MNLGYGLMLSGDPMKARAGGEIVKFFNYARNDLYDNDKMVPATLRDVNGSVWKAEDATCHQFSAKKFLDSVKRQSSHYEVIYGENGNRVTDPRDKGTANYIPRDLSRGKVKKAITGVGHGVYDVVPWVLYGTGADDSTTWDRVDVMVRGKNGFEKYKLNQ